MSFVGNKTSSIWIKGSVGQTIRFGTGNNIGAGLGAVYTLSGEWQRLTFTRDQSESLFGFSAATSTARIIEVWVSQLETGSVATSYIPTEGSQVTRPADVISKTNVQDLIGQTEGTIFIELNIERFDFISFFSLTNESSRLPNRFQLQFQSALIFKLLVRVNNVNYDFDVPHTFTDGTCKIAIGYKENDYAIAINGNVTSSTSTREVPVMDMVNYGSNANRDAVFNGGYLKTAYLIKSKLPNLKLQELTTL
jgi:hypothetical protein